MHTGILCGAALSLLATATASVAEQQPRLLPSRDVAVVYRAPGPHGTQIEQRVRWLAAAQTMRIDPPNHNLHVIVDYLAGRMSVVDDTARSVMQMAAPDSAGAIAGATAAESYTRLGQGAVAGSTCTEWRAVDRQGHAALVCITEDGVLLRAGTPDTVRVSATSVQYAPQDAAAFRIPADYARVAPETSQ
jgi:hypothetical protein